MNLDVCIYAAHPLCVKNEYAGRYSGRYEWTANAVRFERMKIQPLKGAKVSYRLCGKMCQYGN